jgi:hypothetical protein
VLGLNVFKRKLKEIMYTKKRSTMIKVKRVGVKTDMGTEQQWLMPIILATWEAEIWKDSSSRPVHANSL